ncbi:hypothetical protein Tco_0545033 [Tanacetum coccineum]
MLEAILNTLLMNDKSKDTAKARQDLQNLGIRRPLWLTKNHKGKIVKPQAAYSFTPENRKKFCQYIKGVKLPDGFGSCFKHKVTDNDTNITGLKSHDCHIMMQRLLPYGLQNYLPDNIAKPIIELSSLFKQLCSATLMEDDMLKASVKVVEILCELERIYPPAFFDIMIHLPIHLALEALEGGPIHPRWMFPFERFMKKLKGYVRNKAKPEGSIAEGYVAEEALTLSSHYFRDVTTKFNRLERNVDPPPPTCRLQTQRLHNSEFIRLWANGHHDFQSSKLLRSPMVRPVDLGAHGLSSRGDRVTNASTCTCKKPTIPTRLSFKPSIGRRPHQRDFDVEAIRGHAPEEIQSRWDKSLSFGMIPRTLLEPIKVWLNRQNELWSHLDRITVVGSPSRMRWPQDIRSTLSLLTPSGEHTLVDGEVMKRLEATGPHPGKVCRPQQARSSSYARM